MLQRQKLTLVRERLNQFPAVALLGPRQVGKTTLAEQIAADQLSLYLDLESPGDRARLSDPELYLSSHADKLVILDEVQRLPELFAVLRGLIDQGRRSGASWFTPVTSITASAMESSGSTPASSVPCCRPAADAHSAGSTPCQRRA